MDPRDYYFVDIAIVAAREEFFPTRRRVFEDDGEVQVCDDPRNFDPPDMDLKCSN